jgi:plastocyanin
MVMTMRRIVRALLGGTLVLVIALVAACSSSGGSAERIEVKAREFSFEPAVVTVRAGTQYRLVLRNTGTVGHDWTIERIAATAIAGTGSGGHDMGGMDRVAGSGDRLHVAASAGKTSDLTFTPAEPGEYDYLCTVPGHADLGMRGRLVVQG